MAALLKMREEAKLKKDMNGFIHLSLKKEIHLDAKN